MEFYTFMLQLPESLAEIRNKQAIKQTQLEQKSPLKIQKSLWGFNQKTMFCPHNRKTSEIKCIRQP